MGTGGKNQHRVSRQIRLGTRASKLAMWQAQWAAHALSQLGHQIEIVQITTEGDIRTDSLHMIGGQGVFTKGIQQALLANEIDLAVHSLKDLPTLPIEGLAIAAVPQRESTCDVLVNNSGLLIDQLPTGAKIGTGSARRAAQLLFYRDDLVIKDIRGNVDTRLAKLDEGQFDAIVLAQAGLNRLGLQSRISQQLDQQWMLPAVGQGALALETRSDDRELIDAVSALTDRATHQCVIAERAMLRRLEAGCQAPVGCLSTFAGNQIELRGVVLSPDGKLRLEATDSRGADDAHQLGQRVADDLLEQSRSNGIKPFWK